MNTKYWTKAVLYSAVENLRYRCSLLPSNIPIDSKVLAKTYIPNLVIEEIPFSCRHIGGIIHKGKRKTDIALNASRTAAMQNHDCMHEVIHYFLHDVSYCQRICYDGNSGVGRIDQDSYIEWQANEGTAQFLVPYQDFIPVFTGLLGFSGASTGVDAPSVLADRYGVTTRVIELRIKNLSYEIDQYRQGIPVENITFLSLKQQRARGITPTNYLAACDFGLPCRAVTG